MRTRVAVLMASLAASPLSWPDAAAAVPPRPGSTQLPLTPTVPDQTSRTPGAAKAPTWDTFSAEVTIRRHVVRKDGAKAKEAPPVRYRWERRFEDAQWKSTLTVLAVAPATVYTGKGREEVPSGRPVSRVEIGGPGTPTRAFDAAGKPIFLLPARHRDDAAGADAAAQDSTAAASMFAPPPLSAEDFERATQAAASDAWLDHVAPRLEQREARRRALTRGMGASQGAVRGLDRFVATKADEVTEVLADPAWAVPLEINVTRDGGLVSHTRLSYRQDPGAGLIRQRFVTERLLSPESGDRSVIDVEFDNVRLGRRGVR
jgi:hypothetical protein